MGANDGNVSWEQMMGMVHLSKRWKGFMGANNGNDAREQMMVILHARK